MGTHKGVTEKIRNSNIEFLRILSMIMIIAHHYMIHGAVHWESVPFSWGKVLAIFAGSGGRLGVVIFVLISGYFGIKAPFSVKRIVPLFLKTWLYSVVILVLMLLVIPNTNTIDGISALKHLFPFIYSINWFVVLYIIMYLLSPYLQKLVAVMDQREHLTLICFIAVLWSVIPTLSVLVPADVRFSQIGWFIELYLIGAYLRLYPLKRKLMHHFRMVIFWLAVIFFLEVIVVYFAQYTTLLQDKLLYFSDMNMVPAVMLGIELVLFFVKMKPHYSKFVNAVGGTTLGIYLIHDNDYVRHYLWIDLFNNVSYWEKKIFWPHFMISVLIVFIVCATIDYVFWGTIIGRVVDSLNDKYFDRMKASMIKIISRRAQSVFSLEETVQRK